MNTNRLFADVGVSVAHSHPENNPGGTCDFISPPWLGPLKLFLFHRLSPSPEGKRCTQVLPGGATGEGPILSPCRGMQDRQTPRQMRAPLCQGRTHRGSYLRRWGLPLPSLAESRPAPPRCLDVPCPSGAPYKRALHPLPAPGRGPPYRPNSA